DILQLETELSGLVLYAADTDEMAKRFDLTSYKLQRAVLEGSPRQTTIIGNISTIGKRLMRKSNVPAVANKLDTLVNVIRADFWEGVTVKRIEQIRQDLRELVQ